VGRIGAGVGLGVGRFVGDGVLLFVMLTIAVPGVVEISISIESTVIVTVFPVPPKFDMAYDCP